MSDLPPASEVDPPDLGAPVVCKKCAGDPTALRHAKGCPNISDEARRRRERKPSSSRPAGRRSYAKALEEYAGTIGTGLQLAGAARGNVRLAYDGEVILRGASQWAESVDALAAENESVARVLDAMLVSSAWGNVIISTAGIMVPLLACHRVLPPAAATIFGMPPPPPPPAPEPDWSDDAAGTEVPPSGHDGIWPPGAAPGGMANGQSTGAGAGNPVPPMA